MIIGPEEMIEPNLVMMMYLSVLTRDKKTESRVRSQEWMSIPRSRREFE